MERINQICRHPLWKQCMAKIETEEQTRRFCRHGITHLMDVARLAWIENLERGLGVPKPQVYAAALVHDLGRAESAGVSHEQAGLAPAFEILQDCNFFLTERNDILEAVSFHRDERTASRDDLAGLIYRADKASRLCLFCPAEQDCNWTAEKKNMVLRG